MKKIGELGQKKVVNRELWAFTLFKVSEIARVIYSSRLGLFSVLQISSREVLLVQTTIIPFRYCS